MLSLNKGDLIALTFMIGETVSPEAVLRLAGRAAGLQVPDFVFRCRIFQPVGQGDEDRQGASGPACADPGADPARHQTMPAGTEIERRDRALIAFTILTVMSYKSFREIVEGWGGPIRKDATCSPCMRKRA
jgi:hypothetical protein